MSEAPWTDEQVAGLIRRQNNPNLHAYTCANGHGPLSVGNAGWECLACDYRQTWAHDADIALLGVPDPTSEDQ